MGHGRQRLSSMWPLLILPPWLASLIPLSSFWLGLGNASESSTAPWSCALGTGHSPYLPAPAMGFDLPFCSDSGEDRGGPERRREGGERREEGGSRSQVARGWKEAAGEAGLRAVWGRQIHLALCCLSLLPLPSLLSS